MNKKKIKKVANSNTDFAKKYSLLFFGLFLLIGSFIFNGFIDSTPIKTERFTEEADINKVEVLPTPTIEVINEYPVATNFTSTSYLVYDLNQSKIVAGRKIDEKVANASTTKLMSAYVAYNDFPLDKIVTVPENCVGLEGSNANFYANEEYFLEDMLYAILLRSAGDAVCAVSQLYDSTGASFVEKMNATSQQLNLTNTNYVNAIGFDSKDHYSSAKDLLNLILKVRTVNKLNIVMGSRYYTLRELKTNRQTTVANTNEMLFNLPGTVGFKTGTTDNAGECIVYGYSNGGVNLIIIVMGSKSRFYDIASLLDIYLSQTGEANKPLINEATKIYEPLLPTPNSPIPSL